jgi:hypothetical protein
MTETDHQDVTDAVRDAVQSKTDVHRLVKDITLKALTKGQLDVENIRKVSEAVGQGINEGVAGQDEHAGEVFAHAATALDDALAIAVEASTLAVQEAAAKVSSKHEFNEAINDIQGMEKLFFDTLEKTAKGGSQVMADIVSDFIEHNRRSGTAVGKQVIKAVKAFAELPKISGEIILSTTAATTSALAKIASGILMGIAESLQPTHSQK